MRMVGRALQFAGLIIAPMALYYGLEGSGGPGVAQRELLMLTGAVLLFLLGRWLEGAAGAQS